MKKLNGLNDQNENIQGVFSNLLIDILNISGENQMYKVIVWIVTLVSWNSAVKHGEDEQKLN